MRKIVLLTAAGVGYVLGARAGRERYEQIKAGARKVAENPRVQSATSKAQETVTAQAGAVAGAAKEKVGDLTGGGSSTGPTTATTPTTPTTPDEGDFIRPAP